MFTVQRPPPQLFSKGEAADNCNAPQPKPPIRLQAPPGLPSAVQPRKYFRRGCADGRAAVIVNYLASLSWNSSHVPDSTNNSRSCLLPALLGVALQFTGLHAAAQSPLADDANMVSVLYATLRNHGQVDKPVAYYGDSRGKLTTGSCEMEFRPVNGLKQLADSSPIYIPDRIRSLRKITEFSLDELWKRLDGAVARDNGNLVLYTHGYNISFQKACRRAATFQRELDLHGRLLLFSWPANGNLLTYTRDVADISWSVDYLEKFLASLHQRYGAARISLVGHSLGARGLVDALTRLGYGNSGRPLFNELVLIAPDIDSQVFLQQLAELRPLVSRITLYASANDKALKFSNEVHGAARLGEAGERLTLAPGVETIDVSALESRSVSGHIYHQHDSGVIADIKQLIDGGKGAARRSGLAQRSRQGKRYWVLTP